MLRFSDFSLIAFHLIAFHFEKISLMPSVWIPLAYAIAMGVDGIIAPFLGIWYDRFGIKVMILITGGEREVLLSFHIWCF
ncbi:hypothetical protein [Coxiella-like endosymbiont]|uniref:hypothetical protein n=1 Tax=Coxiella-like endosymbiont TaxID=1592897 RepID=UPI002729734A|nr:hypothetical protein [Coxiella-like endosymbiont]